MSKKNDQIKPLRDEIIAHLITVIDSPNFINFLFDAIQSLIAYDAAAMFVYSENKLTYLMTERLEPYVDEQFMLNYSDTFKYSPFYQAHYNGLESGIYTMHHLASINYIRRPDEKNKCIQIDDAEETGYRTHGWPEKWFELDIAIKLKKQTTAQIAFYKKDNSSFTLNEINNLESIKYSLAAIVKKYCEQQELRYATAENAVSEALRILCRDELTKREYEVLQSILNGCKNRDIAGKLNISEETVKTHRKKAYDKIGIKSKPDLFFSISRLISSININKLT